MRIFTGYPSDELEGISRSFIHEEIENLNHRSNEIRIDIQKISGILKKQKIPMEKKNPGKNNSDKFWNGSKKNPEQSCWRDSLLWW